jgi:hypothetical protein
MKKNLILVNAFFILLITACKPEKGSILPTKTVVEGKVTNAKTNLPLADVTVFLRRFNTSKGIPKSFSDYSLDGLIREVKTDSKGYYRIEFEAKSDSSYVVKTKYEESYFRTPEEYTKLVKSDETQIIDFNLCQAPFVRVLYFNDKKLETDSLSFHLTRYIPCAGDKIETVDDSDIFFLQPLVNNNSLSGLYLEGAVSGIISYFSVEDDKEVEVKMGRFVKGKSVGVVIKKLQPRIGNKYPQDTVHFVF